MILLRRNLVYSNLNALNKQFQNTKRLYATRKRFYKNTNVLSSDNKYEVTLDNRKLKTPNGSIFSVKSEPLAIAVATEWQNQKEKIMPSIMHLTSLCFTSLDNPHHLQKTDMINYIINFIQTDTVLYHSNVEADLAELQKNEWDPVISWFNKRYGTHLDKTMDIITPHISESDKMNISKYLSSHDPEILHGFVFAVDTVKSVVLAFAAIDQFISVEKAIHLTRLEEEYQLGHWGRVEWAHDLSQQDLQARLAAALLFIHFNRSENLIKEKLVV